MGVTRDRLCTAGQEPVEKGSLEFLVQQNV